MTSASRTALSLAIATAALVAASPVAAAERDSSGAAAERSLRSAAGDRHSWSAAAERRSTAAAKRPRDRHPARAHRARRAKLIKRARKQVERRNGVEVMRVSRCAPRRGRRGRPNFRHWICNWRAQGTWAGEVPYHCAGEARWRRGRGRGRRWQVEPCENRLQPRAPLLAAPRTNVTFGYNDQWIVHVQEPAALDLLEASGAQVARSGLIWWRSEGAQGPYDWRYPDLVYQRLLERGIKPLWVVLDAPCWAQPDPGACAGGHSQLRPAPEHYDDLARFAAAAAQRYPESIGIEVWNEPNYPRFWGGWPQPDDYALMLGAVADAVHAAAPGMPVISGGLSPHSDSDTKAVGYGSFLDRLYALGAAQKADAIGIHPYPGVGPNEDYVGDMRVYLGKVQQVMARYGDSATPLWATEFGVSTTGEHAFPPELQGPALVALLGALTRVAGVDLALVHRFVEDPALGGSEAGFGIVGADLAPKPAFCELLSARAASPPPGVC